MRHHLLIVAGLLAAAFMGGLALAKNPPPKVAGEWQVKFTPSANTCGETGLVIADEVMKVTQTAGGISASLPLVSNMTGTVRDGGGFNVARKKGETGVAGLKGAFEMSGTFTADKVEVVLVGHYFVGRKPHCEQSWTGTGVKR